LVRLLVDTHVLVWADQRPGVIAPQLRIALTDPANEVFVSAASIWEIAVKRAIGKLRFDRSIIAAVTTLGFEVLSITGEHAEHAGGLPRHHNDPFDRLLVAQASLEGMVLGTQDQQMRPYGIAMLGLPSTPHRAR
jgi:PIN domain nuclease of toxin-antitoxin system